MSHTKRKPTPYCLNCHYPTAENDSFCPHCGQKATDGKISLHDLLHEFVHSIAHLDGKIFTTLRHLFIPGKLTVEFFEGRHKRYAHPIQLFIVLCGLSLIFSGRSQRKLESSFSKNEIREEQVINKSMLFELDSIAKVRYQTTPSVYDSVHRILIENYSNFQEKEVLKPIVEVAFTRAVDALDANRESLLFFENYKKTHTDTTYFFRINRAINIHHERIAFLKQDSAVLSQKLMVELNKKTSEIKAMANNPFYKFGKSLGAKAGAKKEKKLYKLTEELLYADTIQPQNIVLPTLERVRLERAIDANTIKRDSTRLIFYTEDRIKLDDRDILNLSFKEIIEKYKIEGWFGNIATRITYNFTKDAEGITHSFLGKKMYVYVALMLPLAGFMLWLYRRQKRYFVEHIVFLMHYFCLSFLLEVPNFFFDLTDSWLQYAQYILEYLIILPFAIKRYYQQSWVKTYTKAFIIVVVLYTMSVLIFLLGLLLSLAVA